MMSPNTHIRCSGQIRIIPYTFIISLYREHATSLQLWGAVARVFNLSTWGAETDGSLNSRPLWIAKF